MNRLFIELYLDEDIDVLVADLVRAHGFKATITQEAGQIQKPDAQQLAYAVRQQAALLTHNRMDFETLHLEYIAAGRTHHGIIIAVRRPVYELVRRLWIILNRVTADEMQGQLRYI